MNTDRPEPTRAEDSPVTSTFRGSTAESGVGPHTSKSARVTAIIIGVIALALIAVLATRDGGEKSIRNQFLCRQAPPVQGPSAIDATVQFDLSEQRGKYVVINFFATWRPPCVKEHPELVALQEAHRATGDLEMVSVVYQDEVNDVKDFFKKRGGTWPVLNSDRIAVDWGVRGVPETYIVDRDGTVIYQNNGGVTRAAIERVLAEAEAN